MEQNLSLFQSTMVIACVQTSLAIKEIGEVSTLGGGTPYESDGDALLKVKIKPQGRPMWVWLKLKLTATLKEDHTKTDMSITTFLVNLFMHDPKAYLNGQR